MNADELRYKMKHLGALCPDRSVANRVESIQNKIDLVFKINNKGAI